GSALLQQVASEHIRLPIVKRARVGCGGTEGSHRYSGVRVAINPKRKQANHLVLTIGGGSESRDLEIVGHLQAGCDTIQARAERLTGGYGAQPTDLVYHQRMRG